jgi:hypothetical protein
MFGLNGGRTLKILLLFQILAIFIPFIEMVPYFVSKMWLSIRENNTSHVMRIA